ncbi:MAG: DUF502 domain-containing protein [Pseudomonadota bacterium]
MAQSPRPKRKRTVRKRTTLGLLARLRGNFLTGLVIVAPVGLTIWLIWSVIEIIDAQVVPLVPQIYRPETYGYNVPGFGVIIFLLFTALVGYLARGIFGRQILNWGEALVERMPIVRSIYNGLKQIAETILSQSNNSFKSACLVEYPRRDIWAVAFISTDTKGEVAQKVNEEMVSVFLPTTPNPTSGFLLFVPRRDIILLDMEVEDAAKLIISAGLVTPPTPAERAAGIRVVGK